eukprot:TRINITY_DN4125_c0_g1_i1.p1 TRINITY_DN4125_c0_g1~~TRINITY_DN4125_c0_g1_i1.p1  ORF type:complete len:201 (+),score=17.95 TRINITY_DN4125_c0_g1_i1:64-603(+)
MPLSPPFNFKKWIDEHRGSLKPPVGACLVFESGDFVVMVVGGPNRRNDYHINETCEFFYQLEGDMLLKVVDDGNFRDIPIKEGEVFLLPANVPHSPQRFENTVGLVVEHKRLPDQVDRLRWYCEREECQEQLYEEGFKAGDDLHIGALLVPVIKGFYDSDEMRTCKKCSHVTQPPPKVA